MVPNEQPGNPTSALVAKLGRGELHFAAHGHAMTAPQRETYRRKLADLHPQVDAALLETGTRIEDHGWTTTAGCWHRVGEAPVPLVPTAAERIATATFRQAYEMLADVPELAQAGRKRTRLETALNEAVAADDLEAVTVAAAALLDWAVEIQQAETVRPIAAGLRPRLYAAGKALDFPELTISTGVSVVAGEEAWRTLCGSDRDDLLTQLDYAVAQIGGVK